MITPSADDMQRHTVAHMKHSSHTAQLLRLYLRTRAQLATETLRLSSLSSLSPCWLTLAASSPPAARLHDLSSHTYLPSHAGIMNASPIPHSHPPVGRTARALSARGARRHERRHQRGRRGRRAARGSCDAHASAEASEGGHRRSGLGLLLLLLLRRLRGRHRPSLSRRLRQSLGRQRRRQRRR